MKVKFIVGKYKPAEGDEWFKSGDVADLPDVEAKAAIAANVAVEVGYTPVQNITEPVSEIAARVRGTSSKKE